MSCFFLIRLCSAGPMLAARRALISCAIRRGVQRPLRHALALGRMQGAVRAAHSVVGGVPGQVMPFVLADIGEGIAEVEIMQWFKEEGDTIQEFDALCEVRSDKAAVTITSPFDGVITKRHYAVGDVAKTGLPLIDVRMHGSGGGGGGVAAPTPHVESKTNAAAVPPVKSNAPLTAAKLPGGKVLATPTVRRMARQHGLDLSTVPATGRDGRILKGDVLTLLSGGTVPQSAASPATAAMRSAPSSGSAPASGAPSLSFGSGAVPADRKETLRGIRKAMAKSMTAAASVPWFGYADEIEMDGLIAARASLKPLAERRGVKLTYMPFIIKATALALQEFPLLNSTLVGDDLTYHGAINVGVAIDTPNGLVVPNIKHVPHRSIFEVAQELARLQGLAMAGKLGAEDLSGGTFTISNIGNIGGTYLSPVPLPSEVAIGAIGRMRRLPRFNDAGAVVARTIMEVSWRADHRVVDGGTIARFSEAWRQYLENPVNMIAMLR